ncbi:cell division protein ZipA C-terminal FtsZ-binding domain-containing protein [Nitrosomonadaceae bacterium]|nr:cell division protein ZipA C-terminal FtsZ-binding domain-containing protein [Nitrosomonadaceae bacterium]
MSDLQVSLIIVGILIIGCVVFYNWIQRRRYERNTEKAFKNKYDDVLLETEEVKEVEKFEPIRLRVEPTIVKSDSKPEQQTLNTTTEMGEPDSKPEQQTLNTTTEMVEPDSQPEQKNLNVATEPAKAAKPAKPAKAAKPAKPAKPEKVYSSGVVDYVVSMQLKAPVTVLNLTEILKKKVDFGKPVRLLGQKEMGSHWEEITIKSRSDIDYTSLRACLQLVDRSGPVSEVDLSKFCDMVRNFSDSINADADTPDIGKAYSQAILLDQFCAEVDVMIGINVISKDGGAFTGTKIRSLAEASGFKLEGGGVFNFREENEDTTFTLQNYESTPFMPDNMRTLTTNGVTFLFDVPRIKNGERVFDQMTRLSEVFATTLGGIMVDDNRVPLNESGLERIKHKVSEIQAVMKLRGFPTGDEIALRLFV